MTSAYAVPPATDRLREEKLVREHLPLVGYAVHELAGRLPAHVSRDDLTSAGMAALAQAARGFDDSRGVPFGRFAARRIRGAMVDELRSQDWASRSVRSAARTVEATREALAVALGRTPTPAEVATAAGTTVADLDRVSDDVSRAVVLSLQGFADSGSVEERVSARVAGPEEVLLDRERAGYLHDAVAALPERLRVVVEGYFFGERPMAEIAAQLGVTESRVSQLRAEALTLLRDGLDSQLDPERLAGPDRPTGVVARRRQAYYADIAARGTLSTRLASGSRPAFPATLGTA